MKPAPRNSEVSNSSNRPKANQNAEKPASASGLQKSIHGILYQLKLLMLFLCRGINKKYTFSLATEWEAGEKFDDVVFEQKDEKGRSIYRFLQAKHKQSGNSCITETNIFKERNGEFSVEKYFVSYRKIKRNRVFAGDHIVLKDFIISTNINIEENIEYLFNTVSESDQLLDTPGWQSRRLKFNEKAIPKLTPILKTCTDIGQLAKKLSELVVSNKRVDLQDEMFKKYHAFLTTHVIDVEKEKFKDEFFDLKKLERLRNLFFEFLDITDVDRLLKFFGFVAITKDARFTSKYLQNKFGPQLAKREIKGFKIQLRKEFKTQKISSMVSPSSDDVSDEEIKDFVARFVFAVQQPDEVKLSEIIAKELGENDYIDAINDELSFTKFFVIMIDWLKTKGGCFLSHEEGKEFIQHIKLNLDKVKLYVLTSQHKERISKCNVEFNADALEKIKLNVSEKQIVTVVNNSDVVLSVVKIEQILRPDKRTLVLVNSNQFLDVQESIENALTNGKVGTVVIECNNDDVEFCEVYMWLTNFSKTTFKSKICVVAPKFTAYRHRKGIVNNPCYAEIRDEDNSFINLTSEAQLDLLERSSMEFYGQNAKLNKLITEELFHILNEEVLMKLLRKETLVVGKPHQVPTNNFFMSRTCMRHTGVDERIKRALNNFIIINQKQDIEIDAAKDVLVISKYPGDFDCMCKRYAASNIHWVKANDDQLIWQKTHGSVKKLRKYINPSHSKSYAVKTVYDIEDKVVVISGKAGMGKSTLLHQVLKETEGISWVVKINLLDHSSRFKIWTNGIMRDDEVKNFVRNAVHVNHKDALAKGLFDYHYEKGEITLLCDGFDEISPDYKNVVIALLKKLKGKLRSLWITSRPYNFIEELDDELDTMCLTLQPFTSLEKRDYLRRLWNALDDEKFDSFVDELFERFADCTNDVGWEFMEVPLQANMVAEVFEDAFRRYHHEKDTIGDKLNLLSLYEQFVSIKFDRIWWEEKTCINKDEINIRDMYEKEKQHFLKTHMSVSLFELFSRQKLETLLGEKIGKIDDLIESIATGKERRGIIDTVIGGKPRFVHRTFAEYFAAKWFCKNHTDQKVVEFLKRIMFLKEYAVIRNFINYDLAVGHSLHNLVIANKIINVKNLLVSPEAGQLITQVDSGGRMVLHVAASLNHVAIVEELLKTSTTLVNSLDGLFGMTPLWYAVQCEQWEVCELLLRKGGKSEDVEVNIDHVNNVLLIAASNGYIELLKMLTKRVDVVGDLIVSAMHGACKNGHSSIVEFLVEKLGNYVCADKKGNIALHVAAKAANADIFNYLLLKGADPKTANVNYQTVLHCAVEGGNLDIVKSVVENGVTINARDIFGQSALHFAIKLNDDEIGEYLISKGINCDVTLLNGQDVVMYATWYGATKIVKLLIENGANCNARDINGETALHIAIKRGYLDIVKLLMKYANFHVLHFAIQCSSVEVAKYLIKEGIDCEIDKYGDNILHQAIKYGNLEIIEYICNGRIDLNARDQIGRTALHIAVYQPNPLIVKYIVDNGVDLNITTYRRNFTALCLACERGTPEIAKILLEAGADFSIRGKYNEYCFNIAIKEKNLEIAKTLTSTIPEMINAETVQIAIRLKCVELVDHLIDLGVDVHHVSENGRNLLHSAAWQGDVEIIKRLINCGVKANIYADSYTPLLITIRTSYIEATKYLVENGGFYSTLQPNEQTQLEVEAYQQDREEIRSFLITSRLASGHSNSACYFVAIEMGILKHVIYFLKTKLVEPFETNDDGLTGFHFAAKCGQLELVECYINWGTPWDCVDKSGKSALYYAKKYNHEEVVKKIKSFK